MPEGGVGGQLNGLADKVVGHRITASEFKPSPGCVRRVFHLLLNLIIYRGPSTYLVYSVYKRGRKTRTFNDIYWSSLLPDQYTVPQKRAYFHIYWSEFGS